MASSDNCSRGVGFVCIIIFYDMLSHWKTYALALLLSFILAAVFTLSLFNYYTCTIKLAPEMGGTSHMSPIMSELAAKYNVNIGTDPSPGGDAIFPALYPEMMNGVDFVTSLFGVLVNPDGDKSKSMTYYEYLSNYQKRPWWTKLGFSKDTNENTPIDPFRLTRKQNRIVKTIRNNIQCTVDKRTTVLTISVTDYDPYVAAQMADSVKSHLQRALIVYRTSKARAELDNCNRSCEVAKKQYEKSRKAFAEYAEYNRDIISEKAIQRQQSLENDMDIQYDLYKKIKLKQQRYKAKVQEESPVFEVLNSASVPLLKAGPGRALMCLKFLAFVFVVVTFIVLYKEKDLKIFLKLF